MHGANFSVHVDGRGKLLCAKRRGFLAEHEDFFGHFAMLTKLRRSLQALARDIIESLEADHVTYVTIFGELCGGKYPHPDVTEVPYVQPVQVGVWYSPAIEFIVFDVAIFSGTKPSWFLPFKSVTDFSKKHQLPAVPVLFVGSRGDCSNYDPKYTSLVPSMFALPPIAGNLAEGIVVKPWDCETLMDERPIFKIKIQEFQEGEGSAPPPGDPSMKSYLLSQINENRLAAAASKVGPLTDVRGWEEIINLVIEDIRDEIGDDPTLLAMEQHLRCVTYDLLEESRESLEDGQDT